ncbi:VanW family protein [Terrabacter sp. 2RAF25]|uniref:VanW family protein n=1 Tax=Terrabacter sp. 2RAF25 TaxID=3232998 RepID=UPI003F9D1750
MQLIAPPEGFVAPARVVARRRPAQNLPALYPLAVWAHRCRRLLVWMRGGTEWAGERLADPLAHRVKAHGSLLMRELSEDEMHLQRNKVVNLRLASRRVDTLLIRPGETFSFNKVVGSCTRRRGYVEGMRLSNGEARAGVGGGICQLANLLHWMFLHSELTILERSEHSFDPFPDKARVLPWGVGCSIVYNYVDLVVRTTRRRPSSCSSPSASATSRVSSGRTRRPRTRTRWMPVTSSSSARAPRSSGATRSGARSSTSGPAARWARSCSSTTALSCATSRADPSSTSRWHPSRRRPNGHGMAS